MKKIVLFLMAVLVIPFALADYGHMMGYGMMGIGNGLYAIYGVLWFSIASLVFSIIFWTTYKLLVKDHKKTKR